jgi:O-antigen ligase
MLNLVTASLFFLAAGVFTSVSVLSVYQILFAIPLAYFGYQTVRTGRPALPKSAWFLLAFSVVAALSLFLNLDVIPKPSKNFGRIKYFLYGIGGIFVLRAWLATATLGSKRLLFRTLCMSLVVAGLYSAWQFFGQGLIRSSGLTETMRYGYGSAMILLVLSSSLLHRDRIPWVDVNFGVPALMIGFLGMYLTYTRGALLGFLCGLPVVFFFYRRGLAIKIGAGSLLIILVLAGFNQFGGGKIKSRFLQGKESSSDQIRKSLWTAAVIATQERPLFGWGFSNFHSQLKRIKDDYDLPYKDYNDAHAHNLYLDVAAGTGLVGITLFLGWLVLWAYEVIRSTLLVKAVILPLGVAFVLSSTFEVTLNANNASMVMFFYSLSAALKNHVQDA